MLRIECENCEQPILLQDDDDQLDLQVRCSNCGHINELKTAKRV